MGADAAERPGWATLRRLFRHRLFVTGLLLFALIAALAAFAPWITTADPTKLSFRTKFLAPSPAFVFGTDNLGRSLWSRCVWGARLSVEIGGSARRWGRWPGISGGWMGR